MVDARILIVEDDNTLREKMQNILRRSFRDVRSASLPLEALELIEVFVPDIVITDIRMPQISGLEMIAQMRQKIPSVAVIVASAFSESTFF